jgi:ribose transport system substrate-binding protein
MRAGRALWEEQLAMVPRFAMPALMAALLAVAAPARAQNVTIGVLVPSADHGWTGGIDYYANLMAARLAKQYPGLKMIVKASASPTQQANQLEDFATVEKVNALVILPDESAPLTEPVAEFKKEAGAFITVVDRGLTDPTIQDLYVAGNNPGMGRVSGEYFKQRFAGESADIVVLRGIPTVIDTERYDAFVDAIKGTKIHILASQFANWNRDDGFKVMQDFLSRFNHIDAVWAQDDDTAIGVLAAIRQAHREGQMWVLGGGGMQQILKLVAAGDKEVPADVLYPPGMIATAMELTAMNFYTPAAIRGTYSIAAPLITPKDAADFLDPKSPY